MNSFKDIKGEPKLY